MKTINSIQELSECDLTQHLLIESKNGRVNRELVNNLKHDLIINHYSDVMCINTMNSNDQIKSIIKYCNEMLNSRKSLMIVHKIDCIEHLHDSDVSRLALIINCIDDLGNDVLSELNRLVEMSSDYKVSINVICITHNIKTNRFKTLRDHSTHITIDTNSIGKAV